MKFKKDIPKKALMYYISLDLSYAKIAKKFDCSASTIRDKIREYNLVIVRPTKLKQKNGAINKVLLLSIPEKELTKIRSLETRNIEDKVKILLNASGVEKMKYLDLEKYYKEWKSAKKKKAKFYFSLDVLTELEEALIKANKINDKEENKYSYSFLIYFLAKTYFKR